MLVQIQEEMDTLEQSIAYIDTYLEQQNSSNEVKESNDQHLEKEEMPFSHSLEFNEIVQEFAQQNAKREVLECGMHIQKGLESVLQSLRKV